MIVFSIFFFLYCITILIFSIGFDKVLDFVPNKNNPITRFTIVIPFRNEAKNLDRLLNSFKKLKYPKELYEFIFVDDASTDASIAIINSHFKHSRKTSQIALDSTQCNIRILKNIRSSNSPKKDAITNAIAIAKNEWIITTDADCELPENWLHTIDNYIQQHQCNMLVAPVTYKANNSFIQQFQLLDFLSLQASTISGFGLQKPFLCNGANLAYKKAIFKKVNGFQGNNSVASGDDIFLFEKCIQEDAQKVHYLKSKEAIATSFPVHTFRELVHQRVRWASKTANYNLSFGKFVGMIVLLGNLFIAILPFLMYTQLISINAVISYYLLKFFFDYLLLNKVSNFYQQKIRFSTYLKSSIAYPYFIVLIFLKSIFTSYQWKNRTFKK